MLLLLVRMRERAEATNAPKRRVFARPDVEGLGDCCAIGELTPWLGTSTASHRGGATKATSETQTVA